MGSGCRLALRALQGHGSFKQFRRTRCPTESKLHRPNRVHSARRFRFSSFFPHFFLCFFFFLSSPSRAGAVHCNSYFTLALASTRTAPMSIEVCGADPAAKEEGREEGGRTNGRCEAARRK